MKNRGWDSGITRIAERGPLLAPAVLSLAFVATLYSTCVAAAETAALRPSSAQSDPGTIYVNALTSNAGSGRYWVAIQYGELLNREALLDAATSETLAKVYMAYGSYSDVERVAQTALDRGVGDEKQRKTLTETLADAQIKEGKREPSFGQNLLNSLLSGAAAGLAEGLTGQQVDPSTGQPANLEQRQAASQEAERQAQQRAASELLLQDVPALRNVYPDLRDQTARLSPTERKRAKRILDAASEAYGREDYSSAQSSLHDVLAIDPTNATANYYYADCLARGSNDSLQMIDYLARALAFDSEGQSRALARTALQGIASPQQSGQN